MHIERKSIINELEMDEDDKYLKMPLEKQRYLYWMDKIPKSEFDQVSMAEDDEHIYYSESTVEYKFGASLYLHRKNKRGFTYHKKTKKVQLWFGVSIEKLSFLQRFLKERGLEWVTNEGFKRWLTKTMLEKILSGAITNPKDACRFLIKQLRIEASPELLRKHIKDGGSKLELWGVKSVLKSVDVYLDKPGVISRHKDMIKQAKALGEKIDFRWSPSRLKEVHAEYTKRLMAMEIEDIEDETVKYPEEIPMPEGFEFIRNKKRLFTEGQMMHHCVYTNYWDKVKEKKYIVLHVTDTKGNEATAGIWRTSRNRKLEVDQVYAKYNEEPSDEIKTMVDNLIKLPNFKKAVFQTYLTKKNNG